VAVANVITGAGALAAVATPYVFILAIIGPLIARLVR